MVVYTFINELQLSIITKFFTQINLIHNISTRKKNYIHRPNANLSSFQKSTFNAGIKNFNNLPPTVTILKNYMARFKVAFRKYLITHSFYFVDVFGMFKDDL